MKFLAQVALLTLSLLINVFICSVVCQTILLLMTNYITYPKTACLTVAILSAVLTLAWLRFNHFIREFIVE